MLNKTTILNATSSVLFFFGAILSLTPMVSAPEALIAGIVLAIIFGNPFGLKTKNIIPYLLQFSVVGLGFGMNLLVIGKVGLHGIGYTVSGIALTFVLGTFLGRALGTSGDVSLLITVGTAICGGSAIAAVAPVIKAKSHEISVALATVFLLNAVALLIFPWVGHYFGFSDTQFGLWSALAIHDTSSVVGATLQYGGRAVEVGTTIKLARALWIAPVAFIIGYWRSRNSQTPDGQKNSVKIPWFILGFIVAAALVTWIPEMEIVGDFVESIAKRTLVLTLFLIGAGLSRETLRNVGLKPLLLGVSLWVIISVVTMSAILTGLIS